MKYILSVLMLLGQIAFSQKNANTVIENGWQYASIEVFDDTSFRLSMPEIVTKYKAGHFKPLAKPAIQYGNSKANHWLRIQIPKNHESDLILELDNPRLNEVSFFEVKSDSIVNQVDTGDELPFYTRNILNKNWLFLIKNAKGKSEIYLKINKQFESLSVNIKLHNAEQFYPQNQKKYLQWGILAGLVIIVLLINSFVWVATNDAIYGWFMLIIITSGFHILAASGLGFQYIWPNFPQLNGYYPQTFSTWILIIFQMYFMQLFIGQNRENSKVYKHVKRFIYTIFALLIIFFLLLIFNIIPKQYFQFILIISLILNLLVIPIALASIFERIKKRENIILFFTVVSLFKAVVLLVYLANVVFKFTNFGSLDVVLYGFLFDLIVLSIGVIYFGFAKYRLQNELLLTSLHISEQAQSQKIIEALEIERNRIAEDLYDDVGAMLSTAIGYQSNVLRKEDNKTKFPLLVESRKLLERAVENLRTVSHNLMPKNFAELGLSKSLAETINKVAQNSSINIDYQLVGKEIRLEPAREVQIFRIAAELINDILQNSEAKNATIQLIYSKDNLTLMAEDDGPGEPFHNNLTSKVDFINGKLSLDFSPNGLTAVVEIPY